MLAAEKGRHSAYDCSRSRKLTDVLLMPEGRAIDFARNMEC